MHTDFQVIVLTTQTTYIQYIYIYNLCDLCACTVEYTIMEPVWGSETVSMATHLPFGYLAFGLCLSLDVKVTLNFIHLSYTWHRQTHTHTFSFWFLPLLFAIMGQVLLLCLKISWKHEKQAAVGFSQQKTPPFKYTLIHFRKA